MARIELTWGGGSFDVVLDIASGTVLAYSSAEEAERIHARFGGQNYYRSLSGASGAGWLPASLTLRKLSTYRVDTRRPQAQALIDTPEALPGFKIVAPVNYKAGHVPHDWPFIVQETSSWTIYLVNSWEMFWLIGGHQPELEEKAFTSSYITRPGWHTDNRVFRAMVSPHVHYRVKQVFEAMYASEICFNVDDEGEKAEMAATPKFWTNLGLWQVGGRFYKVAGGVARASFAREEIASIETLQSVAPGNVQVLTPNLYVQECDGEFHAVALIPVGGDEVSVEKSIETSVGVKALTGNFTDLQRELEEMALGAATAPSADRY